MYARQARLPGAAVFALFVVCSGLMVLCGPVRAATTLRKIIVVTDFEPDDIIALHLLAAAFQPEEIVAIGTGVMDAAHKKQQVVDLMAQLGMGAVPVLQGIGGTKDDYPDIVGLNAAKEFDERGDRPGTARSSDEFYKRIIEVLENSNDGEVEFAALTAPIDLANALETHPALRTKIKMVHTMGGWKNRNGVDRSTYNWNIVPATYRSQVNALLAMYDVPITIYSSHEIYKLYGSSINMKTCPAVITAIHDKFADVPTLESCWQKAAERWDEHLVRMIPYLEKSVKPYVGKQFCAADPTVIIAMANPMFVTSLQAVWVQLNLNDMDPGSGFKVDWCPLDGSNHVLVTGLDKSVFEDTFVRLLDQLPGVVAERMALPSHAC